MDVFSYAITRLPGKNYPDGLTTAGLGSPDLEKTRLQHQNYCDTLSACGMEVRILPEDPDHPDSTFVEDTAVLTRTCAVITHPGAASRQGEVETIRPVIQEYFEKVYPILPPGTVDGGDVCDANGHFFIGVSERTNENGARQLVGILARHGYDSDLIDITRKPGLLHLKSGLAWLGADRMAAVPDLIDEPILSNYKVTLLPDDETYAANCLLVNGRFLVADGYPKFARALASLGHPVIKLDMSEFRKMDGGLSCLSLRF